MMSIDVAGVEADVVGDDVDVGVEQRERLLGRVDLAVADAVHVVEDLALQVRLVDDVHVDDADRADAGGGEVEGGRRAEAAGAEQQDLGLEQLELALDVDLGQEQVALVAVALIGGEVLGDAPVAALVLPLVEAAGHRGDVGVAELGERLGRERRPDAGGAVDQDLGVLVGDLVLDVRLELAPGDEDGARDRALGVLVGLAHVEDDDVGVGVAQGLGFGGLDLADLGLGGRRAARGSWAWRFGSEQLTGGGGIPTQ